MHAPGTVRELLNMATARLAPSASARLDAELLLCEVLELNRAALFSRPERAVDVIHSTAFEALIDARRQGQPVAYLRGRQEFWSLDLEVSPAVLVPRADTELLVEVALQACPTTAPCRILELGTGSGAIALALARERPQAQITAVERSPEALAVARRNQVRLGIGPIDWVEGDWHHLSANPGQSPLPSGQFTMVVSNPPYLADDDPALAADGVAWEPRQALVAADGGLADLRAIIHGARRWLAVGGWVAVEHGASQGAAVRDCLRDAGFAAVATRCDLVGLERVSLGRKGDTGNG